MCMLQFKGKDCEARNKEIKYTIIYLFEGYR